MTREVFGRDDELRAVDAYLRRLPASPGVLVLEGEPGIGKTTLWMAGLDRARELGHRVLSCRPIQTETPLAFVALADLLEPVLDERLRVLPPVQAHALEVASARAQVAEGTRDVHTVAAAALSVMRSLAADGPVLLAVDDLPWTDAPSARVLEFLVRRVDHEPIGLLVTSRTGERRTIDLRRAMPPGRLDRLVVGPLSVGATQRLLREDPGVTFSRPLLLRIHRTSGGNPLFAAEMARAVLAAGHEPAATEPLPFSPTLSEAIRARLGRLGPAARKLLVVVSFLAQPTLGQLDAALPDPEQTRATVARAVRAGVLEVSGDRVRFAHPLLAAETAAQVPAERRIWLHRELSDVVTSPEERARHLALATTGPDEDVAAELESVADDSYRRGATDAAVELSDLSIALTHPGDPSGLRRRMLKAADHRFAASDLAGSRSLLERVVAAEPPGPGRAAALQRLAEVRLYADRRDAADDILAQALDEAGDDPSLLAAIHRDLGRVRNSAGDLVGAAQHLVTALALARRSGDPELIGQLEPNVAILEFLLGRGVRWDLIGDEPSTAPWPPHLTMDSHPNVLAGNLLRWADDHGGARARFEVEYRRALERGVETGLPLLLWGMADLEIRAGRWDLASVYVRQGYEAAAVSGSELGLVVMDYPRALLAACRGQVGPARAAIAESLELSERHGMFQGMMWGLEVAAFLEVSLGNPAAAVAALRPLLEVIAAFPGPLEPAQLRAWPDAIEAKVMLGDLEEAEALLGPFEESSIRLGRRWGIATAGRGRGLVLAARGDLAGALAAIEEALEVHPDLEMPLEHGRTLLAMGEVRRRARQRAGARQAIDDALRIFEGLGAPLWVERARAELGRLGLARHGALELTEMERRVAELAASGSTNRDIAAEVFMSIRTVEGHLSAAYRKLGIRTRSQLGRALDRDRRADPPPEG
jgi:DNA-binding CsgD family transcriptional regulator